MSNDTELTFDEWMAGLAEEYGQRDNAKAAALGVSPATFSEWRKKQNIPPMRQLQLHLRFPSRFPRHRLSQEAMPDFLRDYLETREQQAA